MIPPYDRFFWKRSAPSRNDEITASGTRKGTETGRRGSPLVHVGTPPTTSILILKKTISQFPIHE